MIKTSAALDRLRDPLADVTASGARGDGRADDAAAIQEIIDHFAGTGGEWYLPAGIYRLGKPLTWRCTAPQRICGHGKRAVYPGRFDPKPGGLAILLPVHGERAAIDFVGARDGDGTIEFSNLALATLEAGPVPVAAFGWDAADHFLRDFSFDGCSIHGFTSAFDLYRSGGANSQMGIFRAHRCTINRNRWIARTLDGTQWNGFAFRGNEAGQNGYLPGDGGIAVTAHQAEITGNCLEGQRDPIRLFGAGRGASVRDNYFEANIGTASIHLENVIGPFDIGPNTILTPGRERTDHCVLLTNCGHGRVLGSYWAEGVHKMLLPISDYTLAAAPSGGHPRGLLRLDGFDQGTSYTREPLCRTRATQLTNKVVARATTPWNGLPMPVAEHDTGQHPSITLSYPVAGTAGDWVAVCWLFRHQPGRSERGNPYISLSVNGTGAAGSRDYIAYNFDTHWQPGEWCLLTAAIRLDSVMTNLVVTLYPDGNAPAAGALIQYIHPVVYVTDAPEHIIPYIDDHVARSVAIAPKLGNFHRGDVLINASAGKTGQVYYVKIGDGQDDWGCA